MKTERPHRRVPWQLWYLLSALGFALALLGQLGKEWGWWNDVEALATWAGLALGVYGAVTAASERTVRRLAEPLERLVDNMATVNVVLERVAEGLERIERLLTERLPPR